MRSISAAAAAAAAASPLLTAALHEDFEDICQMLMRAGADDAV